MQDAAGRIYASGFSGVFEITDGDDISGDSAHATGAFFGLAITGDGKLLASVFNSGEIYDITGGDLSGASLFASNLRGFGDVALDVVPEGIPQALPALTAWTRWALTSLLLAAGVLVLLHHRSRHALAALHVQGP